MAKNTILAIETSCDETGLAVIEKASGQRPKILHNLVFSQEQIHAKTKGVVPEIAAREQVAKIFPLLKELEKKINFKDIKAIAVANGPGLVGSLLIGLNTAKTLAYALNKPIVGINHIYAHLYASFLYDINTPNRLSWPLIGLIVSGGHTSIVKLTNHQEIEILGQTLDDAAGESFDKVATLLDLGYPGGPAIEKALANLKPREKMFNLPLPLLNKDNLDFSFSGLKTAVLNVTKKSRLNRKDKLQLACEFEQAITTVISGKLFKAYTTNKANGIIMGGGVIANKVLRDKITKLLKPAPIIIPPIKFCTDNAAMIGARASYLIEAGKTDQWQDLKVQPTVKL